MYNKFKKLRKKSEGITLVALVVTIIVLLILAGVKEKLELMYVDYLIDGGYKDTEKDEIDIFLDIMGDKDITKEDVEDFNKILEQYGKKIIGITNVEELKSIGTSSEYPLNGLYYN